MNSITAEIRNLVLTVNLLLISPPANPPRQKKIMDIVNVRDIWDIVQSGKSSLNGALNIDQAYISPRNSSVSVPVPRYSHLLFVFIYVLPSPYIMGVTVD